METKTIKRIIINSTIFIALIILTFAMIFKDQDMGQLIDITLSANRAYILLGLFIMVLYFLVESYNVKKLLETFGNEISILKGLKYTLIGFFFSAITPAASGGQPAEVYYMNKDGIPISHGTMTLLIQVCGYQISTISLGVFFAILNPSIIKGSMLWLFLLGLIINGFALTMMLIGVFSRRLSRKIIEIVVKILEFFKAKNIEEKKENMNKGLEKYHESSKYIKEHKREFLKAILRVYLQIGCYYLIPFCVYKAFGLNGYSLLHVFAMQAVLYTTVSSLPLPGAVGISEHVFLRIFGPVFGIELLSGAVLLNRGINFYLFVIISLIIVFLNIIANKRKKWRENNGEN